MWSEPRHIDVRFVAAGRRGAEGTFADPLVSVAVARADAVAVAVAVLAVDGDRWKRRHAPDVDVNIGETEKLVVADTVVGVPPA